MPLAPLDAIADVAPPDDGGRASLADILEVTPPAATRVSLADIAGVEPPAAASTPLPLDDPRTRTKAYADGRAAALKATELPTDAAGLHADQFPMMPAHGAKAPLPVAPRVAPLAGPPAPAAPKLETARLLGAPPVDAAGVTNPASAHVFPPEAHIAPTTTWQRFMSRGREAVQGAKDDVTKLWALLNAKPLLPAATAAGEAGEVAALKNVATAQAPNLDTAEQGGYRGPDSEARIAGFEHGVAEGAAGAVTPLNVGLSAVGGVAGALGSKIETLAQDAMTLRQAVRTAATAEEATTAAENLAGTVDRLQKLEAARSAIVAGQGLAGAGFTAEGVHQLITAPTWGERAQAVAEIAGGAAMAAGGYQTARRPLATTNAVIDEINRRPPINVTPGKPAAPPVRAALPPVEPGFSQAEPPVPVVPPTPKPPAAPAPEAPAPEVPAAPASTPQQLLDELEHPSTPPERQQAILAELQQHADVADEADRRVSVDDIASVQPPAPVSEGSGGSAVSPEAPKPTAVFIGFQETGDGGPPLPIYNIKGGPRDRSTVMRETLEREGIDVPPTPEPPAAKPQTASDLIKAHLLDTTGKVDPDVLASAEGWVTRQAHVRTNTPAAQMPPEGTSLPIAKEWIAQQLAKTGARPVEKPVEAVEKPATAQPWTELEKGETHTLGSTQVNLPPELGQKIAALAARIPQKDLAPDGRETEPHITVKYGLHTTDVAELHQALKDEPPITVKLGKTSIFPNGESNAGDVVKFDVDSPDLHRLNAKIAAALKTTDTHPDYKPHATLAYVKPGLGEKYAGYSNGLEGQTATIDRITFTAKDGRRYEIPLAGGAAAPPADRKAQLEALATDEAMGVRFPEDGESTFPDGSAAVVCTNCAKRIIELAGGKGEIYGWEEGTNPTSVVAGPSHGAHVDTGQGHDFAVLDGRYLVDAWAKNVEGSSPRAVFDLNDPAERAEVRRLYGDPTTWLKANIAADGDVDGFKPGHPPQFKDADGTPNESTAGPIASGGPETRSEAPGVGEKPQGKRAGGRKPSVGPRSTRAQLEDDAIKTLIKRARADGFKGDVAALRAELRDRLQLIRELDAQMKADGYAPTSLLRAIARYGGISEQNESANKAEIAWLKAARDQKGAIHGVRGVFRPGGLSLDGMVEALQQDPEFQHIGDINDLLEELTDVSREPREQDAATRLIKGLGDRWWETIGTATPSAEDAPLERDSVDDGTGDLTFDPTEFDEPPSVGDVLDTGEVQPRLPEAGAVRETEKATPQFEAPFSLSSEVDTTPKERPRNLFGGSGDAMAAGSKLNPQQWAQRTLNEHRTNHPSFVVGDYRYTILDSGRVELEKAVGTSGQRWKSDGSLPGDSAALPKNVRAEVARRFPAKDAGTTLDASFVPGGRQFIEQDVTPTLQAAGERLQAAAADVRATFAPDTLPAGVIASGVLRSELAAHAQRTQRAQKVMTAARDAFAKMARQADGGDKAAREEFLRFTDAMEGEAPLESIPKELQPYARQFRTLLSARRTEVQRETGRLQSYIKDYFPHEWAKPGLAKKIIGRVFGRRPLQGSKAFLKQRSIPTTRQGVERGLVPTTWNPAELVLHKLVEMDKFLLASRVLKQDKQLGIAKFVRATSPKNKPEGWVRYPESFGTVYGPPTIEMSELQDADLVEALETFAANIGATVETKSNLRGGAWGLASRADHSIKRRIGGSEGVLMHEIGHILDYKFELGEKIGLAQASERKEEINFSETPSRVTRELRALADLRADKMSPESYRIYIRKRAEQIANLVHAFLYAPQQAKEVAPNAYWALYNLAKDTPELNALLDIQKTRGLRLGQRTVEHRLNHLPLMGHYYGPPDAVRILEQHLSPGLRGNAAFDLYRTAGNFVNQVQLALSTYHGLLVSFQSIISKQALALELAARGRFPEALKTQAQVPVAPILDLVKGHKALRSFYDMDANARTIDGITAQLIQGGGGVGWDKFWHEDAPARFWRTLQSVRGAAETGNYPGAALRLAGAGGRAIPAFFELSLRPIMEGLVPRLKVAAYLDRAQLELPELGPAPALSEVRRVLGNSWDAIDNRFGELRYDNLFWKAAVKDVLMITVRAVGFNVGTIREVYGAPGAQLAQMGLMPGKTFGQRPTKLVNTGTDKEGEPVYERQPENLLNRRLAYMASMVFVMGTIGGMTHYLRTGERPKTWRDYFWPGPEGDKWALPSYLNEVFHSMRDLPGSAVETAGNKLHPMVNMIYRTLVNESFEGVEIRNPDDPWVKQALEQARYIIGELEPLPVRNIQRDLQQGESTTGQKVARVLGLSKAPATVTRTPAEQMMHDISQRRGGHETLTLEQGSRRQEKGDIRRDLRAGDVDAAREKAASGDLSKPMLQAAARESQLSNLERMFRSLPLEDALRVYQVATPAERRQLRPWLGTKIQNAQPAPSKAAELQAKIAAAMKLPIGGAAVPVKPR